MQKILLLGILNKKYKHSILYSKYYHWIEYGVLEAKLIFWQWSKMVIFC